MAKPFSFKLQKILDYRGQIEDQAKMALARAQENYRRGEEFLRSVERKLEEHVAKEEESRKSVNDMWLWRQYHRALQIDLSNARSELQKLASILQKARQEAVQRSRERKLLEKLKENQARKHYEEQSLREQKENDEMATLRYKSEDF